MTNSISERMRKSILFSTWEPEEWYRDHRDFVLFLLVPQVNPRPSVTRVLTWAYTDGMEARSDGSSVVPDWTYPYGRIKDPAGVGHDWLFERHRKGLPDPSGHDWTLWEANRWYREALIDMNRPVLGWVRWVGLTLGSWVPWNFGEGLWTN